MIVTVTGLHPYPHCTLLRFLILKLFFDTISNPVRKVVDSLAYLWEQVCYSFSLFNWFNLKKCPLLCCMKQHNKIGHNDSDT